VDDLYLEVSHVMGELDVVVNAMHCQFTPRAVADSRWDEDWVPHIEAMRVHVELCRRASVQMSTRGYGRIVLVSGALAARPMLGCSPYSAIKAGLHGFHRVLAQEVGAAGVTVNAVAPCRVQPDDERSATEDPQSWEELNDGVDATSALPRDPLASEVASAVGFLTSPAAGTMTGQVLYLSRGQVMLG
jgi:3-oxoacyl-[acyl-carrier protein] reductase